MNAMARAWQSRSKTWFLVFVFVKEFLMSMHAAEEMVHENSCMSRECGGMEDISIPRQSSDKSVF